MTKDLPKTWRWATIGDVADVTGGLTKNAGKRDASKIRVPLVSVAAVHLRRINSEAVGEAGLLDSDGDRATLARGDLLIVEGNGSLEHIGRVALWNDEVPGARHQNHIIRVRPHDIASRFVLEWLASPSGREAIVNEATSAAGLYTLSLSKVERLPIPVPPLNEQCRIVAKLEALQARSRRAREALVRIADLEDQLVRSWTKQQMPTSPLEHHIIQKTTQVGEKWRDYRLVGLSNEGRIIERREAIGQKTAHKCRLVEPGDIVFNPIRFSIGSIARYRGSSSAIVSPEYQVMSTRVTLSAELLVRYLRSRLGRSTLETETTGSVRYRVYFKDLQRVSIPLAPPEQQVQAESLLGYLSILGKRLQEMKRTLADLDTALLAQAFRGELVPQDPNDEPAEAMLARVREQNSANAANGGVSSPRQKKRKVTRAQVRTRSP